MDGPYGQSMLGPCGRSWLVHRALCVLVELRRYYDILISIGHRIYYHMISIIHGIMS